MGRTKKLFFSVHLWRSIDLFLDQMNYSRLNEKKKCSRPDYSVLQDCQELLPTFALFLVVILHNLPQQAACMPFH